MSNPNNPKPIPLLPTYEAAEKKHFAKLNLAKAKKEAGRKGEVTLVATSRPVLATIGLSACGFLSLVTQRA